MRISECFGLLAGACLEPLVRCPELRSLLVFF